MENTKNSEVPLWMLPQLWGLDVPLAVLCWSLVCATHMQITMISEGPILLVVVMSWVCTILARVYNAVRYKSGWYYQFYISRAVPLLLMAAAAGMAALWMFLYYVGRHVMDFGKIPLTFGFLACVCRYFNRDTLSGLFKGLALGFACMVPAFTLSFLLMPIEMLRCAPCWYMGFLFFMFLREKSLWQQGADSASGLSIVLVIGLFVLLVVSAFSSVEAPYPEQRSLFITIVTGAACLMVLAKVRPYISNYVLFALCWSAMALPPLIGLIFFPPSYWGPPML